MAAGLKERRATVTDNLDLVAQEVERAAQLTAAARQLCQRIAAGHRATHDEKRLFAMLKWDESDVAKEVGRWSAVARWQGRAGTAETRAAAETELASAKTTEAKEGPELDQRIADLTRQRTALAARVTAAQRVVDESRAACGALRELSNCQDEVSRRRSDIRAKYHSEVSDLEGRARLTRDLPTVDGEGRRHHAEAMEREGLNLVRRTKTPNGMIRCEVDEAKWAEYVAGRQAELPDLETRLAGLLDRRAAEITEVEQALDDLIPK